MLHLSGIKVRAYNGVKDSPYAPRIARRLARTLDHYVRREEKPLQSADLRIRLVECRHDTDVLSAAFEVTGTVNGNKISKYVCKKRHMDRPSAGTPAVVKRIQRGPVPTVLDVLMPTDGSSPTQMANDPRFERLIDAVREGMAEMLLAVDKAARQKELDLAKAWRTMRLTQIFGGIGVFVGFLLWSFFGVSPGTSVYFRIIFPPLAGVMVAIFTELATYTIIPSRFFKEVQEGREVLILFGRPSVPAFRIMAIVGTITCAAVLMLMTLIFAGALLQSIDPPVQEDLGSDPPMSTSDDLSENGGTVEAVEEEVTVPVEVIDDDAYQMDTLSPGVSRQA